MMTTARVCGLIGSPRAHSTSQMLAHRILDPLAATGWQAETLRITAAVRAEARWATLEATVRAAQVVVLAFPLYVDTLPAGTTLALERLAASYRLQPPDPAQRWLAIVNCGFAEARHNDLALAICRQFARAAGVAWSGGVSIGGGGLLSGQPLEARGGMTRGLIQAFDGMVAALAEGRPVPEEAFALASRPLCPGWLYFTMANLGMLKVAYDHKVLFRLNARPYAEPAGS